MKPKNILIIKNDNIGDLVLTTPVFREIKKVFPNSKITLIASRLNKPLVEKNKYIDEILQLETPKKSFKTISDYIKMALLIKKRKFDIGIDFRSSLLNSFFLLWLPGVKKRISATYTNKLIRLFVTNPIEFNSYQTIEPIVKENLRVMNKGLGINSKNYWPEIFLDKEDELAVLNLLKQHKIKKYICICPAASMEYKQWDTKNFEEIVDWISLKYKNKYKIIIFGGKDNEKVLSRFTNKKNCIVLMNFNLRRMFLLFKKSSLSITNDGGPLQIAWASKSKVIALFSREVEWKGSSRLGKDYLKKVFPQGKNSKVIQSNGKINEISPSRVEEEIKKIL